MDKRTERIGKIVWRGKIRLAFHGHFPFQYVLEMVGRKKYNLHLLYLKTGKIDTYWSEGLHKKFALKWAKNTDRDMGDIFEKKGDGE